MIKLQSILVLTALVSSSVVFANTDFETPNLDDNVSISQSETSVAESFEQLKNMDVHRRDGFTENDFFEY
ncbi:MAG: calmodulin [Pseudoalteromonas sp.]|uniref:calmodulin n=1 Tax=unclassified Pseudoalteromonas TaxID=194690 RepID=UPI003F9D3A58